MVYEPSLPAVIRQPGSVIPFPQARIFWRRVSSSGIPDASIVLCSMKDAYDGAAVAAIVTLMLCPVPARPAGPSQSMRSGRSLRCRPSPHSPAINGSAVPFSRAVGGAASETEEVAAGVDRGSSGGASDGPVQETSRAAAPQAAAPLTARQVSLCT